MDKAAEIPVIVYSWETEKILITKDTPKHCINLLANGAFASIYTGANGENEPYPEYVNKHVVFLDRELGNILTDEEIRAVVLHESGHIASGHFLSFESWDAAGRPVMTTTDAQENEADDFAISRGASHAVIKSSRQKCSILLEKRISEGLDYLPRISRRSLRSKILSFVLRK